MKLLVILPQHAHATTSSSKSPHVCEICGAAVAAVAAVRSVTCDLVAHREVELAQLLAARGNLYGAHVLKEREAACLCIRVRFVAGRAKT